MGSGEGGRYSGTSGAKAGRGPFARVMHSRVSSWANKKASFLDGVSKRQRDKFTTATVVYDESTGKYYYGMNRGIQIDNDKKNPILFGDGNRKGILPEKSLNQYSVGNCAEVHAVNKALNAGANLKDLHITTIHTTKSSMGDPKRACENCTYTFKGKVKHNNTGWYKKETGK
ncbi:MULTISPECIES: YwqJ-related putative deaminase [unclassified Butyrivibrio]|jgi:hypothetical protein|uniref:YwqJ-related putative deaminase n=1 Tax=unclassified Butyrivibrio TaxID=2639466 RepID=UPI0003B4F3C6|nr:MULTISPECIES: YwqJ-related putative deaminase [unclassified Butyrivibrio]